MPHSEHSGRLDETEAAVRIYGRWLPVLIMAIHHNLKAIALFRGLRGLVIGSVGIAISSQTDQSLMRQVDLILENLDIAPSVIQLLDKAMGAPQEQLVKHLVVIALAWAMLLCVQAYGLWQNRYWAVWLAFATSVFVLAGFAWVAAPIMGVQTTFIFAGNLLVSLYLLFLLRSKQRIPE